jgi:hypothetical protein
VTASRRRRPPGEGGKALTADDGTAFKRFDHHGPAGLLDRPKGARPGSRLPDLTQRTILLLTQSHPDWGCQRLSDALQRSPALPASPQAVARVLRAAGHSADDLPAPPPYDPPVRHFERARPNHLWQTDLFTFMLKRQNRRIYLVAFLDDHSRSVPGCECASRRCRRRSWRTCGGGSRRREVGVTASWRAPCGGH